MEIAMIYLLAYALLAVTLVTVIALIVITAVKSKRHRTVGINIRIGMIAGMILACMVTVWICSHRSYPFINDWAILGRNINAVEQQYGRFERYSTREDGSGYAVLMTEQIVGKALYDSDEYSCYFMEFDQTGKIVKVYCSRPVGG